jgi:hypothetical protein
MKKSLLTLGLFLVGASFQLAPVHAYTMDNVNHLAQVSNKDSVTTITSVLRTLAARPDKTTKWTVKFAPGIYSMEKGIYVDGLQNTDLLSNQAAPAILQKGPNWNSEYILNMKYAKTVLIQGFTLIGLTDFSVSKLPVWGEQGIYLGSTDGVTIDRNKIYNIGDSAVRVSTWDRDPVKGINSFNNKVTNNYFKNIEQTSTTSNSFDHGGTANYLFQYNTFNNVIGSVKFASRTAGAKNIQILDNWIMSGERFGLEISGYTDMEIRGNKIENTKQHAIAAYTNAIATIPFQWGSNINIHNNVFNNNGNGIRLGFNNYPDGTNINASNISVNSNVFTGIGDVSQPVISMAGDPVDQFNTCVSATKYRVVPGSTNVTTVGNLVNGAAIK